MRITIRQLTTLGVVWVSIFLIGGCATFAANQGQDSDSGTQESNAQEYVLRGDQEFASGNLDEAKVQYALAIENDPQDPDLFFKLGTVQRLQNDLEGAERALNVALELNPAHTRARESLGLVHLKRERYDTAEIILQGVVDSDSSRWQSLNALGVIADLNLEFSDAQIYYQRALELRPESAKLMNNLGYSYYLERKYELAEAQLRNVVELYPDYAQAWSNLALVYLQLNQPENAQLAFEKTISKHQALNNIGYFELLNNDSKSAQKSFTAAIKASPSYYPIAQQNLSSVENRRAKEGQNAPITNSSGSAVSTGSRPTPVVTVTALPNDPSTAGSNEIDTSSPSTELTREDVLFVQRRLSELGYNPGPIDGVPGNRTIRAIRSFQSENQLPVDGRITQQLKIDLS